MKMRNVQLDEGWMIVRHDQPASGEKQQLVDLWEMREISDCLKDGRQFLADLVDSFENRALRVCPMLHELSNSVDLAQIVDMLCGRRRSVCTSLWENQLSHQLEKRPGGKCGRRYLLFLIFKHFFQKKTAFHHSKT